MWSAASPKPAENLHSDDATPHNAPLRIIRCTREDAEVGAALAIALRGDELHGLNVEAQGLDRAGEAVLGLGEGADGRHCRVPFSNRAAPIATSMVFVRPGTIGPHPKCTAPAPDGGRRLFCFAMQSAARAAEKSWRRLLREDDRGEAGLRSDPIHSRPQMDGAGGNYLEYDRQQRHFAKDGGSTVLAPKGLPLNGRVFDSVSWRHRGPLTPHLRSAIVSDADDDRPPTRCDRLDRAMIVLFALYAAWLSRPPWHADLMSLTQAIEARPTKELCDDGAGARWPQPPPFCVSD